MQDLQVPALPFHNYDMYICEYGTCAFWPRTPSLGLVSPLRPPADIATAARRSATILATWFVVYFGFVIGIYRDRFSKKHRDIAALSLSLFALPLLPLGSRWVWPADGTFLGWSGLNGTV